jgi:hypothetical protein
MTAIVVSLEDSDPSVIRSTVSHFLKWREKFDPAQAIETIVDELVVRNTGRAEDLFGLHAVVDALRAVLNVYPTIRNNLVNRLVTASFQGNNACRVRVVNVVREIVPDEFTTLVRARADEDPASAAAIMGLFGGGGAMAFFSERQGQALERYRSPLITMEDVALDRWKAMTQQTRRAFYVNVGLSIGIFILGATAVVWGLVLVTRSDNPYQIASGALLSGASVLAAISRSFWQNPVEHIQGFASQQSRLEAGFIGYMNRVAQIRTVFESRYSSDGIGLDDLERYQTMLAEANEAFDRAAHDIVRTDARRPASR